MDVEKANCEKAGVELEWKCECVEVREEVREEVAEEVCTTEGSVVMEVVPEYTLT